MTCELHEDFGDFVFSLSKTPGESRPGAISILICSIVLTFGFSSSYVSLQVLSFFMITFSLYVYASMCPIRGRV